MKRLPILSSLIIFAFLCSGITQAQEKFGSAGLELAVPLGDFADSGANFGIGGSGSYEVGINENIAILANAGVIFYAADDFTREVPVVDPNDPANFSVETVSTEQRITQIPIQMGARYYFLSQRAGLFAGFKTGVHITRVTFTNTSADGAFEEDDTEGDTYFSLAPELGFFATEKFSLALRFQLVFVPEDEEESVETDPLTGNLIRETVTLEAFTNTYLGLRAAYNF